MPSLAFACALALTSLGVAASTASPSAPCTFYSCAGNGSDSNAGTSWAIPFASITAAQKALAALPRPLPPGGAAACICAGVYHETFTFTDTDSGSSADAPVEYIAYGVATVSGALPVAFEPAFVHPVTGATVYSTNLTAQGVTDLGEWQPRGFEYGGACPTRPAALVVDGLTQTVARWPNEPPRGIATPRNFESIDTYWWTFTAGATTEVVMTSVISANASAPFWSWQDTANVYAYGLWAFEWADGSVRVTDFNATAHTLTLDPAHPLSDGVLLRGARFFLENSFDALDAAGEYYVNASSGVLYHIPSADGNLSTAVVTNVTEPLMTLTGVSFVTFVGLTLGGGRSLGVLLSNCSDVALVNMSIVNMGVTGVYGSQLTRVSVRGSEVRDVGAAGVSLHGVGDAATLRSDGLVIRDNVISRIGRDCFMYQPAVGTSGVGAAIIGNELFDGPHAALDPDGTNNLVALNVVHHAVREAFDCGALYNYPVSYVKWNDSVVWNFFYLNGAEATPCNAHTSCIRADVYADNGNAGWNVIGNVLWHPQPSAPQLGWNNAQAFYAFMNDGGRNANATGNIGVDSGFTFNGGAGITWDKVQQNNSGPYYAAMRAVAWNSGVYAAAFPALAALHDYYDGAACSGDAACPPAPFNNSLVLNVAANCSVFAVWPPPDAHFDVGAGFVVRDNLNGSDVDPGWATPDPRAALNFQLADNSSMYARGFRRIPMECFGPFAETPDCAAGLQALFASPST